MHILYLHQYYCPEGGWGNDRSADFARRWVAAGHRVTVITTTAYFPPEHPAHRAQRYQFVEHGVKVDVWRVPYGQEMGYLRRAWAFVQFFLCLLLLSRRKVDLIYASTTPPTVALAGAWLSRRWRCPWVLEVVDVWPEVPVGMGILRQRMLIGAMQVVMRHCYQSANQIVALSEGMRDLILPYGTGPARIHVVENGTDVATFSTTTHEAREESAPVRLVYAGAFGRANAVGQLLDAAERLQHLSPRWQLHLYGNGSERDALAQRLAQSPIPGVSLHSSVPKQQMPALLAAADIGLVSFAPHLVLESNSANKFFDYLAAGLPVMLNYQGWQARVLAEHMAGLSAPQGDLIAFVKQLERLITDAELRKQMGVNAHQLAAARYDRALLSQQLLELFSQLIRP